MQDHLRHLLVLFMILSFGSVPLKAQSVSFQGSFGYDEYGVRYLDKGFMGSKGYNSRLFMTSFGGSFGIEFATKRGGIIRPRFDFAATTLLRYGFFRRNEVLEELVGDDVGTRLHFMLDFGHEEEIMDGKMRIAMLFGFGLGFEDGSLFNMNTEEYYRYEGIGLMMQPCLSLSYSVTPFFRVGLEQRHELSLFQYGQEISSMMGGSHGWTVYTANRFLNYMPPILRAELVLQGKKKK